MTSGLQHSDSVADRLLRRRALVGMFIFAVMIVGGLAIVKWLPLFGKVVTVAVQHTLGPSIVSGAASAPTTTGLPAALQYASAYYGAVWKALVLALVAGATMQVFVPRAWVHRLLGDTGFRSTAIAGTLSLIGMM